MHIFSVLGFLVILTMIALVGVAFPLYLIQRFVIKKEGIGEKEVATIQFPKHFGWAVGFVLVGYNLFFHDIASGYPLTFVGIGIGLFAASVFGALLLAFPEKKRSTLVYTLSLVGTVAAFGFAWRANGFVHSLDAILLGVSLLLLMTIYVMEKVEWKALWMLRSLSQWIDQGTTHLLALFKLLFSFKNAKANTGMRIVKTVVITLIVLFFFANLLSAADPVFAQMIRDIRYEALDRSFISLVLVAILIVGLSFGIKTKSIEDKPLNLLNYHDFAVPAAGLVIMFGAFLFVQGTYLFSDQANFEQFGLTYSEYARKGFIELLVTAFFAGLASYLLTLRQRSETEANRVNFLMGINFVVILEIFAMLWSALQRDLLYIDAYSLSRVRIAGMVLLIWLTVSLLLLLAFNFSRKMKESHQWAGTFAAFVLGVISLNILNMDAMIAQAKPGTIGEKDHYYIANLSTDALHGWEEAITTNKDYYNSLLELDSVISGEEEINTFVEAKLALESIRSKRDSLIWTEKGFAFWNASRAQAKKAMEGDLFNKTLDCVLEGMNNYQIVNFLDLSTQTSTRSRSVDYLFMSNPYSYSDYNYLTGESLDDLIYNELYENEDLMGLYQATYLDDPYYSYGILEEIQAEPLLLDAFSTTLQPTACQ